MYNDTTEEIATEIIKERVKAYLIEAFDYLFLKCPSDINFSDYDVDNETFGGEMSQAEIDLVVSIMFERYLERDISNLKAMANRFTTRDLNMFSPARERSTYVAMFNQVVQENINKIRAYQSIDRTTGKFKTIDFSKYATEGDD
jgi:hypothetical protein